MRRFKRRQFLRHTPSHLRPARTPRTVADTAAADIAAVGTVAADIAAGGTAAMDTRLAAVPRTADMGSPDTDPAVPHRTGPDMPQVDTRRWRERVFHPLQAQEVTACWL
jgi:hypothetical protein